VGFFLGEWFDGFLEFHISDSTGEDRVALWASNGDIQYISLEKASIIYEQISNILTTYYNVETGEQIFPWHHGAGDFVVNPLEEGLPVKLITVRGYKPLMEFDPDGLGPGGRILPALLFFFLNLTLRMRLDRMDGVGKVAFLGEIVLKASVNGFLRGLDEKAGQALNIEGVEGLKQVFIAFMAGFSQDQIEGVLTSLVDEWPDNASERAMAWEHLNSHARCIYSIFKNI
jgi:hypothetical protein